MSAERLPLGKACAKCGETKLLEEFYRHARGRYGRQPQCKACRNLAALRYRADNRQQILARKRRWREENLDKARQSAREWHRRWREANPDKARDKNMIYREKHPEICRKADKRWREENPEHLRTYRKRYYKENREKLLQYVQRWREANPDNHRVNEQRRRARKRRAAGHYIAAEWLEICQMYDHKCLCCGQAKPLTADHVIPLSKGGSNDISNIQPLCLSCNSSKGTKTIDYRISGEKLGEAS